jgi:hypothetical protein
VDHINDMTFRGYEGGRESLAFYPTLFKEYRMGVEEQVTEGNRVASRWVLTGIYPRPADCAPRHHDQSSR